MNENNNRVSQALDDTVMDEILTLLQRVSDLLADSITGLSPAERLALPRIGPDNKVFVQQAINEMRHPAAAQIIPAYLDPEAVATDLKMYDQMNRLYSSISILAGKVDNTRILAGSEAFSSALSFKKMVKDARASGISGADIMAQRLAERFKGQGRRGGKNKE